MKNQAEKISEKEKDLLSNLSAPHFMIIDEGFSCMDEYNLLNIELLYGVMKNMFDFSLIVSHLDAM